MYILGEPNAELVCLSDGKSGIHLAFDLDAQGVSCPACPGVGMAIPSAPAAIRSAVITTSSSTPSSSRRAMSVVTGSAHRCPQATPMSPANAPADERASSQECFASLIKVMDRMRRPTRSLERAAT